MTASSKITTGKMDPAMFLLCVLVDTRTGAIIEIGANVEEPEPR